MNVFKLSLNPGEFHYETIIEKCDKPKTKLIEVIIDLDEPVINSNDTLRPINKAEVVTILNTIVGRIASSRRWPLEVTDKTTEENEENEKSLS